VSEENKKLVREITEVVWNSRGLDRIPEFYALDLPKAIASWSI